VIDLNVFSTRISAFALVCIRVLSEIALFLFGLSFLVVAFAAAISSLEQEVPDFSDIAQSILSLYKITFGMLDTSKLKGMEDRPAVLIAVFFYIGSTILFLLNLLIAQLSAAYHSTYQDMLGFARLNRGRIVTETMPQVSARKWEAFIATLKLEEDLEFGEGDIGINGGIQMFEAANLNVTSYDMIKRYGGSTSPDACWPEEENLGEDDEDRLERLEKYIENAIKWGNKASKKRKRDLTSSGGGSSTGEDKASGASSTSE